MTNWIAVKGIGNLIKFDLQKKLLKNYNFQFTGREKEKESADIVKETVMIKIKIKTKMNNPGRADNHVQMIQTRTKRKSLRPFVNVIWGL